LQDPRLPMSFLSKALGAGTKLTGAAIGTGANLARDVVGSTGSGVLQDVLKTTIDTTEGVLRIPITIIDSFLKSPPKMPERTDGKTPYLVKLKGDSQFDEWALMLQLSDAGDWELTEDWDYINGFAGNFDNATLKVLQSSPHVDILEPDGVIYAATIQEDAPWGLGRLTSPEKLKDQDDTKLSFTYNYDVSGTTPVDIFVLDTGIRASHDDFSKDDKFAPPRVIGGTNYVGGNETDDKNGHGTLVAGIIGGNRYGVFKHPDRRLIPVKVLNDEGQGLVSDVISGLEYVLNSDIRFAKRASVANLSLVGKQDSKILRLAVNLVTSAGIPVVVAAGNESKDVAGYAPSSAVEAICVGTAMINDEMALKSNYGKLVDVFAPGQSISGPGIKSNKDIVRASGSSLATAHVTGLVAYQISIGKIEDKINGRKSYTDDIKKKIQEAARNGVIKKIPVGTVNRLAFTKVTA